MHINTVTDMFCNMSQQASVDKVHKNQPMIGEYLVTRIPILFLRDFFPSLLLRISKLDL